MVNRRRRFFLIGGLGAAGTLLLGCAVLETRAQRLVTSQPLRVSDAEYALNGWVKIGADNTVTLISSQCEMGQGAHTGLAMLLADEMDVAWQSMRVEQSASLDRIYGNGSAFSEALPFRDDDDGPLRRGSLHVTELIVRQMPGLVVTGGSSSIKDQWLAVRAAGASARDALIRAAAKRWDVLATECSTLEGKVLHPSGRSATYGQLAGCAAEITPRRNVTLKMPEQFQLIGKSLRRVDSVAKTDGTARYGLDVRAPGLLYASLRLCPALGGRVVRVDGRRALATPGVHKLVRLEPAPIGTTAGTGGFAVVADSPHLALRALDEVEVEWDYGPAAAVSSDQIEAQLRAALQRPADRVTHESGAIDSALRAATKVITAEFVAPYLPHVTMEPMNCTVHAQPGRVKVWSPTQMPARTVSAVADVLGAEPSLIDLEIPYLGGGFGRRTASDYVSYAAMVAREMSGTPVQTFWSREQDLTHDFYRPMSVARLEAGLDARGKLIAWKMRSATQSTGAPGWLDKSMDGAWNTPYSLPNARFEQTLVAAPVPVGIWRGVHHSQNAFFMESFMDDVAAASAIDPIELRLALLDDAPRAQQVLRRVRELADWSRPPGTAPDGSRVARGVALHRCFGTSVAQVAEVSIGVQGQVRVHRVFCVVDCGRAVNPDLVRQQIESGVVYGLSAALYGGVSIKNGCVAQSNLHDYRMLRMSECPRIETEVIASDERPEGVGEPGTPPIAPAVANALRALTGERMRTFPFRPNGSNAVRMEGTR
jgi:isoquinoline 1-oxidoreductase subunit beta